MSQYTKTTKKKKGKKIPRPVYRKDGELIAKAKLPKDILKQVDLYGYASDNLPAESVAKPQEQTSNSTDRVCIYEGQPTKLTRMINSEIIYLCQKHYYSKNLGQIAQRLREVAHEKVTQEEN